MTAAARDNSGEAGSNELEYLQMQYLIGRELDKGLPSMQARQVALIAWMEENVDGAEASYMKEMV